jgi:hypothetical protein
MLAFSRKSSAVPFCGLAVAVGTIDGPVTPGPAVESLPRPSRMTMTTSDTPRNISTERLNTISRVAPPRRLGGWNPLNWPPGGP